MHHQYASLIHFFHNKEIDELYVSVFLRTFANSLVGVFVPIYLLSLGYSLQYVGLYYLVYFLGLGLIIPFALKLVGTIGVKKTMAVGTAFSFAQYLVLANLTTGFDFIFAAILFSFAIAIYYAGFNVDLAHVADSKETAVELSFLRVVAMISATLGPLFGAYIISLIGFSNIFFLIAACLAVSVIPLFLSKDYIPKMVTQSLKKIVKADTPQKSFAYMVGGFVGVAGGIFWPIFIFQNLKTLESLGFIVSLTSFLMMMVVFIVGKLSDRHHTPVLKLGIVMSCLTWITRLNFLTPLGLFVNNFAASVSGVLVDIPFSRMVFGEAKRCRNMMSYFMLREYSLVIGRVAALVVVTLTGSIMWIFICASVLSLTYTGLLRKHKSGMRLYH